MICELCTGNGYLLRHFSGENGQITQWTPCPDCIGGVSSCCEGEQASDRDREVKAAKEHRS